MPEIPPIAAPEVVALYREIIDCVLVGAHGAAITMATILVEFALKYTVFVCEVGGYGRDDPDMWDELEQATFYPVTRRACASGLIDDKQVEILDRFREQVRNPYAHYNVRKITKGNIWQNVMVYNKETAQTEVRDIAAEDNPVIRAQIKPHFDRANVLIVIANADEIVRELFRNMEAIIASNNPES